jgi:hypothetical protein
MPGSVLEISLRQQQFFGTLKIQKNKYSFIQQLCEYALYCLIHLVCLAECVKGANNKQSNNKYSIHVFVTATREKGGRRGAQEQRTAHWHTTGVGAYSQQKKRRLHACTRARREYRRGET